MIIDVAHRLGITEEYYFSVKLQEVRKLMSEGKDIINIAIGNPDLPPSDATIEALKNSASVAENHGYQPYRGIPELRRGISNWYRETYAVSLEPETEVLPLIGSKEGITHISLTFLNEGDEVLVPELGYPAYKAVTEMVGARAISYPLLEHHDWQPDINSLKKMDMSNVKLLWMNYPHMPTGAVAQRSSFEKLIDMATSKKVLLCHDNPYSLVLNEGAPLSILAVDGAKEVAIELNSLSKSHNMAGWRVGWVAGHAQYIDQIIKIKSNVDSGMFKPVQIAAAEALKAPGDWHIERNNIYRQRRILVYEILDKLGCTYDKRQTGLFVWAKIPTSLSSAERLVDHLLYKRDIFIAPGFIFGPKGKDYIRASLCVKEETLQTVLDRIRDFNWQDV